MTKEYTREQKCVYLIDVLGYSWDDTDEMDEVTINGLVDDHWYEFMEFTD